MLPTICDVDLVFTSPPYNKGRDGRGAPHRPREWRRLQDGYGVHDDDLPNAAYEAWQMSVVDLCMKTLSPSGALFYQHKPITKGPRVLDPQRLIPRSYNIRQIVTWDRGSGFNRNGYHLCPEYEWVLVVANDQWRVADRSVGDVWRVQPEVDTQHPASFPVALPSLAIRVADPALVLDPFMGSGTTLRAAKDLGRKAIGIEIEERYCEIAARRMGQGVLDLGGVA